MKKQRFHYATIELPLGLTWHDQLPEGADLVLIRPTPEWCRAHKDTGSDEPPWLGRVGEMGPVSYVGLGGISGFLGFNRANDGDFHYAAVTRQDLNGTWWGALLRKLDAEEAAPPAQES